MRIVVFLILIVTLFASCDDYRESKKISAVEPFSTIQFHNVFDIVVVSGNSNEVEVIGDVDVMPAIEVSVLNVSQQGCAFRAPVAYRPGAVYTMRIGAGPLHLTSTIRIISSRDRADGFFDIGAKFV